MEINLGGLEKLIHEARQEGEQQILSEGDAGYEPDLHRGHEFNFQHELNRMAFVPHGFRMGQPALPSGNATTPQITAPPVLQMITGVAPTAAALGDGGSYEQSRVGGRKSLFALNPWKDGSIPSAVSPGALANRNANALEAEHLGSNSFNARILGASVSSVGGNSKMPGGMNTLGQILLWLNRIYDVLGQIRDKLDGLGGQGSGSSDKSPRTPHNAKPVGHGGLGEWFQFAAGAAGLAMGAYSVAGADGSGILGNTAFQAIRSGKAGLNDIAQKEYEQYLKHRGQVPAVDDESALNKLFKFNSEGIGDTFGNMWRGAATMGNRAKIWGGRGVIAGLLGAGAIDVGTHAWRANQEFEKGDTKDGWADTREAGFNAAELLSGMFIKKSLPAFLAVAGLEIGKGGLKVAQDVRDGNSDDIGADAMHTGSELLKTGGMWLGTSLLSKMFFKSKFGKPIADAASRLNPLKSLLRGGSTAAEAAEGAEGAEVAAGGTEAAAAGGGLAALLGPILAATGISVAGFSLLGKAVHVDTMQRINEFSKLTQGGMSEKSAAQKLNDKYHLSGDDAFGYGAHAWKGPNVVHQAQAAAAAQSQQTASRGGTHNTVTVNMPNSIFKTPADRDEVIKMIKEQVQHSLQLLQNSEQHANGWIAPAVGALMSTLPFPI